MASILSTGAAVAVKQAGQGKNHSMLQQLTKQAGQDVGGKTIEGIRPCASPRVSYRDDGVACMSGMSFMVNSKCPTKFTPNTKSRPSAVT